MELVQEVQEIERTQGKPLSASEIQAYFADMNLDEKQTEALMLYFQEKKEESSPEEKKEPEGESESRFVTMYMEELKYVKSVDSEKEENMLESILNGEETEISSYTEAKLTLVMEVIEQFEERAMLKAIPKEELIQEGNLSLVLAIHGLKDQDLKEDKKNVCAAANLYLRSCIENALREMIDEEGETKDWTSTVVAKTNLLYEAKKYLEEENGGIAPTIKQLSEYTKIPEMEILDIQSLTLGKGV